MAINKVGREIPENLGSMVCSPYSGAFAGIPSEEKYRPMRTQNKVVPGESKILPDYRTAFEKAGLKDGMTISFHHHFRDGDYVILDALKVIREMGIKGLTLAPSSLTDVHDPIIEFIKDGTIKRIESSGIRGKLGEAIADGIMEEPVILRTHGGRDRAIKAGELKIDLAVLAVSSCDDYGNANGSSGKNICGSLAYAMPDSKYADKVVLVTDNLVSYPCTPMSISQMDVDYIVVVDEIGDSSKIGKGAARLTRDPIQLRVAKNAVDAIVASGFFRNGFSIQTGVGAVSIACTQFLREKMIENGVKARFALGGIGGAMTGLLNEGLIEKILAVQSYDTVASASVGNNPNHMECHVGLYANIFNKGPVVNKLDVAILSALEMDTDFNCNLMTGTNGEVRGALGGGPDSAGGAALTVMVFPLTRGRIPTIVERVNNICTPGETVDMVVTEYGVAVNPATKNSNLEKNLKEAGIKLFTIQELKDKAEKLTGKAKPIEYTDKIVGIIEYRDGSIIDVIRQVKK